MLVDDARRHVLAGSVDHPRPRLSQTFPHPCDLSISDQHICILEYAFLLISPNGGVSDEYILLLWRLSLFPSKWLEGINYLSYNGSILLTDGIGFCFCISHPFSRPCKIVTHGVYPGTIPLCTVANST